MKKVLLFAIGLGLCGSMYCQEMAFPGSMPEKFSSMQLNQMEGMPVTDTIAPPISCDSIQDRVTILTGANGSIISGTFRFSSGDSISEIGQILNTSGDTLEVHSILAFTVYKEEGANKGSFTAAIYDTSNGFAAVAFTDPVGYDNISDTNSASIITRFPFSNPVTVYTPFWAILDVDNGSDTIAVASTADGCGSGSIFRMGAGWADYSLFQTGPFSTLSMAIHLYAEVDTTFLGIDRNFISKEGVEFFPNPAHGQATIKYDMAGENEVTLFIQDLSGRAVFNKTYRVTARSEINLDLQDFGEGAYTYQVVGSKSQLNGVFVKR